MIARRLRLGSLAWLCALAGGLVLGGVSAQAVIRHGYLSQITEVPAGSGAPLPGLLSGLGPMTVDSGHLWAVDDARGVFDVNEFDAGSGAFVSQLPQVSPASGLRSVGLSIAVSAGNVYLGAVDTGKASEGRLAVLSEAGVLRATWTGASTQAGSFGHVGVADVAVDRSVGGLASGSVYVDDQVQGVVDVFGSEGVGNEPPVGEPSAEHVKVLAGTCPVEGTTCEPLEIIPFDNPKHVAVDDSTGSVVVLASFEEEVEERVVHRDVVDVFEPGVLGGYVFLRQIKLPLGLNAQNLGVDGGNGEIYVAGLEGVVDQFSSTGVLLGQIIGEGSPAGDLRIPQSVTVDASGRVFVGDYRFRPDDPQSSVIDVYGPDLVVPDVTTGPATNVTPRSAILTGTVKLDKEGEASCRFLWGTTKEFEQPPAQCSKAVTEEESGVEAMLSQANGSRLEPDTTYYYRLQATNKNGLNPGEPGQDQEFTTAGPGIHQESVSNVAATSVTFDAKIDPNNAPTTSYFQYGTSSAYGTNVPAAPGSSLGSGKGDVEVSPQHVQGLQAGTVYHYRVVVLSELSPGHVEEFDGPDQTFATQSSGGALEVPDGRSWEMVTPPQKEGALFFPIREAGLVQASVNGDAMADLASQPTEGESQGYSPNGVSVLSTRGMAGWDSQVIETPHDTGTGPAVGAGPEYKFFSEDLSLGIVQPFGTFTPLSPEESEPTADLRTNYLNGDVNAHCHTSCFTPLVTSANTPPGTVFGEEVNGECPYNFCGPFFVGATPDLNHILLFEEHSAQLTSTLTPGTGGLYEWTGGSLQLVSVLPEAEGGTAAEGPRLGYKNSSARNAVSHDGSRVIWEGEGTSGQSYHLYLRDVVKGETVRLDLPQGGMDNGLHSPTYMDASSDGSKIFFLDEEHLAPEASEGGKDLYEYDLNAQLGSRLTDLTVDTHAVEAKRSGVLGASEDGSYVYFRAVGVLAPGAMRGDCQGDSPCENLYVRHDGVTKWIAAQSVEDVPEATSYLPALTVRVSPNGRWFAFMSDRNLIGYDTHDAVSGRPDQEVYLYDANRGRLVCASCDPSGARPGGVENSTGTLVRAITPDGSWVAANVPPWTATLSDRSSYQSRYLSDSGRLFFDSNDALVPQDVNGTEDVYEYEPVGVPAGSGYECAAGSARFSERSGGCVGLISSGTSPEETAFLDASATGGDVFFLTASKLVAQDFDTALDVYDAHECSSGSPCFAPAQVLPPACSTGDSCKVAPSPQPAVFGSPSSATFSGAGNVTPSAPSPVVKSRSLTRAQKLARALRACKKKRAHGRRGVCERQAKKRYGAGKQSRKANATSKSGR